MTAPADLLPPGLAADVERASGARIVAVRPRGGGGASREGAELSLAWPDGRACEAYMNYDVHRAGAGDDAAFLREAAVVRGLSQAGSASGLRLAPFIAAIPEQRALVAGRVEGEARFDHIKDADQKASVGADYMAQLARLHAADPALVPELGGPVPIRDQVERRLKSIRTASERGGTRDPLLRLAADWIADNIPREPDHQVIVHGDAGPGNFLYQGDRVTALLDWELVHIGDPMADMAMICLRTLFQPFIPLPDAFAAYEGAGGGKVDLDRVRFWRLLLQAGFARGGRYDDPSAPPPPNLGMNMIFSLIHRRVLAEALAEANGIALAPVVLPDVPPAPHDHSFTVALNDLRDVIVPRLSDQQADTKAKGLARLVKWWRALARYGPAIEAIERDEIGAALGQAHVTLAAAREAFADAVFAGAMPRVDAVRLAHARVARDAALMADAMGGLSGARFLPLT